MLLEHCVKLYISINVQVAPYVFFKMSFCIPYVLAPSLTSYHTCMKHTHISSSHYQADILLLCKLWEWKCESPSCVQLFAIFMDCSPPASSVHGILQARILEWVAIPFFRGSSPLPKIFFPKELIEDPTLLSCAQQTFPIHSPPGEVREI